MNTIATSIRNTLLTVQFGISVWDARKQDKRASKEVAAAHGTDVGVGRYHKDLLPDAPEHEAIIKFAGEWRREHYENTLPWGDNGDRVIRSPAFFEVYAPKHRARLDRWDQELLPTFITAYPMLVAKAQLRLNTLYDPADYPDVKEVRRRFAVRINTYTLPNVEDFRILEGVPPDEVQKLMDAQVAGINERLNDAVKNLWSRMHEVVSNMQARLAVPIGEKGSKFHDTLVGNVQELLDLLPQLNLTNDPAIAKMAEQMRGLTVAPADVLREQSETRAAVAAKAKKLADRMKQYVQ